MIGGLDDGYIASTRLIPDGSLDGTYGFDGTALLTWSSNERVEPDARPVETSWSHSTPPALSTASASTESSKVAEVDSAEFTIFPQTSSGSLPRGSEALHLLDEGKEPNPRWVWR